MRIIFVTMDIPDLKGEDGGFYADMIRCLAHCGHDVTVLCQAGSDTSTGVYEEGIIRTLRVNVPFLSRNTSLLRKGIGSILMSFFYNRAYSRFFKDEAFDFILLPTPPPTLVDVVKKVKKRSGARLYVILRDIQPESGNRKKVSPEILKRTDVYDECKRPYGVHRIIEGFLFRKSQRLYHLADRIGCMSPGNMEFVKTIAPYVKTESICILPNWYKESSMIDFDETSIRKKYRLEGKFIALFGGNIGPQQAVWNIAQLAKQNLDKKDVVFLVVGRGVKKQVLEEMARLDHLTNIRFIDYLPKEDYERILRVADLGLISLDEKYKVPTCPSKIIGYMALEKPVLAMLNKGSDYGEYYIGKSGCGLWSVDLDNVKMQENFDWFYGHPEERKRMGRDGYQYYKEHFTVERVCDLLDKQLSEL